MQHGSRPRALLMAIALLTTLGPLGCKQGENDRCQVDDDCSGTLRCCRRDDPESLIIGGVCTRPASCELTRDAGPSDAATARDARADSSSGGPRDGSPADRSAADTSPRDAWPADTGAGRDARPAHDGH